MCGGDAPPMDRRLRLRRLRHPETGEVLDEALVVGFPEGTGFTGEAAAELHVHGGTAVTSAVLGALAECDGLRLATPGEFARRALNAGRIGLEQVEGLADLVNAETEAQRRQALRAMEGELARRASSWRRDLIRARALVEATLDFADEDIPETASVEARRLVDRIKTEIRSELAGADTGERLREGFEVAIVGPPNVGKSTLLNAIARRDVALTSEIAGTTRDVLEVRCDLGGLPVTVLDTAGLRDCGDVVEQAGVQRARDRASAADLRVHVSSFDGLAEAILWRLGDLSVWSKSDLGDGPGLAVSAQSGEGVPELLAAIAAELSGRVAAVGAAVRARHRAALQEAVGLLHAAGEDPLEIAAEHLRLATRCAESLIGAVDVEAVLDDIFAEFCLGK